MLRDRVLEELEDIDVQSDIEIRIYFQDFTSANGEEKCKVALHIQKEKREQSKKDIDEKKKKNTASLNEANIFPICYKRPDSIFHSSNYLIAQPSMSL